MKLMINKSGGIHYSTDKNECICDLNIELIKIVSEEYVNFHSDKLCKNCIKLMQRKNNPEFKDLQDVLLYG